MHLGREFEFEGSQSLKVSQFYVFVKDTVLLSLVF